MNKTIWIVNEYAGSPYHGMEFRHYYIAKELIKNNYNVFIITASYSHLFKNIPQLKKDFEIQKIDDINYCWIKVPKYKDSNSKKRVLKWLIFTLKLFLLPKKLKNKPEYIFFSPMQTFIFFPLYFLSKKYKSKLIFEVKDIWPLTITEIGNYSKKNLFIRLLRFFEILSIKKSDLIISVLPGYGKYLKDQGFEKDFFYLPNGISLDEMQKIEKLDEDIEKLIPENKFFVGYVGTIGSANSLESFIDAANIIKEYKNFDQIYFLIVGKGSEKEKLMEKAKNNKNIIFLNSIPKFQVQSMLKKFDVCFIGWKNSLLFNYGVSPNKIFDYMYAGKPVLEAISTSESLVLKAKCGIQVEAENPDAIAEAVLKFYDMPKEKRDELGINGKKFILENHTYDKITLKLIDLFKML